MDLLLQAQYPLLSIAAHTLVHTLWQGALLSLLAAASFVLLRRHSAALRHAVGMGFLLAIPMMAVITFLWLWQAPTSSTLSSSRSFEFITPVAAVPTEVLLQGSDWLALSLSLLWSLGAATMLLRQFGGWWFISDLERHFFAPLPSAWQQRFLTIQQALGISRPISVRVVESIHSPFTARLLRPVIWLPATLLTKLPADQVEILLAHELAHIARLDWLWNGLQCVVESLFFFHPGMWWLSRRIRQEREHACDDMAVAVCGNAIALAEALAALEQQRLSIPRYALAAHGGSLVQRITRLLSASSQRPRWRTPAALLGLFCATTLFASQVDLLTQNLVGLHIEQSTDGQLMPGDYREINANGKDMQRYYRISVDKQGKLTEIYKENDHVKPVDNNVRAWLAKIAELSVIPAPPELPEMPLLPGMPPIPDMTESTAFKDLLKLAVNDARIKKLTGDSAAQLLPEMVNGDVHLPDDDGLSGEAKFSYVLTGPKGRAKVNVSGERANGIWRVTKLDVAQAPSR